MPPIWSADVADSGVLLRLGVTPNNAVYTMQYIKIRRIVQGQLFGVPVERRAKGAPWARPYDGGLPW